MNIETISEFALNGKKLFDKLYSVKIAIDIDGTVAKTVESFLTCINAEYNVKIGFFDVFLWNTEFTEINKSTRNIEDYFGDHNFIKNIEVYKYAVDIVNFLDLTPAEILFVTDRPSMFDEETKLWLYDKLFNYSFYANTRRTGKENVNADVLIDDKFDIAYAFACNNSKKLSIVPIRPWNKMYRTAEIGNILNRNNIHIKWFDTWDEVPQILFSHYLNCEKEN
jgi:5'(3')-deoxyribonucleotidase